MCAGVNIVYSSDQRCWVAVVLVALLVFFGTLKV